MGLPLSLLGRLAAESRVLSNRDAPGILDGLSVALREGAAELASGEDAKGTSAPIRVIWPEGLADAGFLPDARMETESEDREWPSLLSSCEDASTGVKVALQTWDSCVRDTRAKTAQNEVRADRVLKQVLWSEQSMGAQQVGKRKLQQKESPGTILPIVIFEGCNVVHVINCHLALVFSEPLATIAATGTTT